MKVILKDNIENLGKKGDIVNVASGYGRNYLVPKKMALEVTGTNFKMIEMVQTSLRKGLEKEMKIYQSVIEKLNAVTLTFSRKAGEKDVIFGSVSVTDIRDALAELGFEFEKKRILLEEPIKRLGNFTVPIKVFQDEKALIKLEVSKEGEPEDVAAPKPVEKEPRAVETETMTEPAPEPESRPEAVVEEKSAEPEAGASRKEAPLAPETEITEPEEPSEVPTEPVPEEMPSEDPSDPEAKS